MRRVSFSFEADSIYKNKRIVLTLSDQPGDEVDVVTVNLTDLGGRTQMDFRQDGGHLTEEGYARAGAGWLAFFERLAEHLTRGQ